MGNQSDSHAKVRIKELEQEIEFLKEIVKKYEELLEKVDTNFFIVRKIAERLN
jgi:DNA-binding transcriptional regulator GbsR (MarR family)